MIRVRLQRSYVGPKSTIGEMVCHVEGWPRLMTLENPWRHNGPDSSIPVGDYLCKRVDSPKFGDTFEVTKVRGRSHILFHAGNTEADTLGCILVGLRTNGEDFLHDSRIGFHKFLDFFKGQDEFMLEVRDPAP